ncbi:hypothetical protein ACFXPS_42565 [Nocardia sp. NPDC059091]|uniref:hypothetical protein n=1 Tax=unclassified Nocardia TaxID=2637762 RepID=UPI0036BF0609
MGWLIEQFGIVGAGFGLMAPAGVFAVGPALVMRDGVQYLWASRSRWRPWRSAR